MTKKTVLRVLLSLVMVISVLAFAIGCDININVPNMVAGSGKPEARDFNIAGFTGVQAHSAFNVQIDRADSYKVTVTADDNLWDYLDISLSGNTLNLGTKYGVNFVNSSLVAVVTMPAINSLGLSGASKASVSGFSSDDDMSFKVSGASTANLDNVRFGSTDYIVSGASKVSGSATITEGKFTLSGASTVTLVGSGTNISINASGASRATLNEFKVQKMNIIVSGASVAKVNAQNITSAEISGASSLYYVGNPTMGNVQTSGASSIHQE